MLIIKRLRQLKMINIFAKQLALRFSSYILDGIIYDIVFFFVQFVNIIMAFHLFFLNSTNSKDPGRLGAVRGSRLDDQPDMCGQ